MSLQDSVLLIGDRGLFTMLLGGLQYSTMMCDVWVGAAQCSAALLLLCCTKAGRLGTTQTRTVTLSHLLPTIIVGNAAACTKS